MMAVPKISDNFQTTEGCKMILPHHSYPTNGVGPSDSNAMLMLLKGKDILE